MKHKLLFVFALGGLLMVADTQAQSSGGKGGKGGQGAPGERGRGGPGGPGGPGGRSMMSFLPVLIALDADKDGKISAKEIANASAALKTLDKNGDGELTEDELRPAMGGRGGPGGPEGGPRRGAPGQDSDGQRPKRPQFDN